MELLADLLPQAPLLHLETWHIDTAAAQVTLREQSTQTRVHCPVCRCLTRRIHRRSRRTVADLPWAHYRVVLQLGVRRCFCPIGAVHAVSLRSDCPVSWPLGLGGRGASCTGWRTSPWPWAGQRAHSSAVSWA